MRRLLVMLMMLSFGMLSAQTYRIGDVYTAPDGSQGIVYYLHPDGSGGWVVALNDASAGCPWGDISDVPALTNQSSIAFSQNLLNDTAGYANTQALRNYQNNSTNYAAGKVDFENGWVLPSPAQLSMLYGKFPFIASAITEAGGTMLVDEAYWCSAEFDASEAWVVYFSQGYFNSAVKTHSYRVRAVRSFTYTPTYVWSTGDTGPTITVSPEQTTAYTVTASTPIGCNDSANQLITVLHYDTTHLYETVCDSYLWYGDSLIQSGAYPHTLTATTGCDSVVTLHLTVNHSTAQTLTINIVENDIPYPFLDTVFYEAGTYVLTLENEAGCDSVLTVVLNVFENVSSEVDSLICEGDLPIVWNEVEFTQAGTQPAILTAASGADSVVVMTVTLIPTTYGTFDTAVVENDLPLHYHNLTCDSAGTYLDTLVSASGCDSILTLNLTVWPNVSAVVYDTVCEGELPFTWNDSVFTAAGMKTTTILAHTGADSTVTMNLSVIPTTYGTVDITVVENDLPFHLHNLTCDTAGVYTDTIVNASGCDSVLTLTLTVWPNVTSELDSVVCEGHFPITWNDSVFTEAGVKTTTILAHTGADSTITMTVTVSPTTYGMVNLAVVENMLPYTYNDNTYTGAGTYIQNLTNVVGCDSVLAVVITVYENVTSLDDSTVCENELPLVWNGVEFTQAGSQSAVLTAFSGADSVVVMTLTVLPTTYGTVETAVVENDLPFHLHNLTCDSAGVYTDTIVNSAGCDSVLTVNLTVYPNVTSALDSTVCGGELPVIWNDSVFTAAGVKTTTILAHTGADSTVTMTLTVIPTTYGTVDTAVVENDLPYHLHNLTCDTAGVYVDTLVNAAGCDSILTLNLTVYPNVTSELDSAVCEDNFPFTWNDSVFTAAGVKTTTILAQTGADSIITMTVTLSPTTYDTVNLAVVENDLPLHYHNLTCDSAGTYLDTLVSATGCDSILTLNLTVWPNVSAVAFDTVCEGELPFTWNDSVFTAAGVKTTTILAHTGADSTVTMILAVIPTTYGTVDIAVVENELPLQFHNLTCDSAGVYTDTLVNVADCDSILTLNLTVWPNATSELDSAVCEGYFPITWNDSVFTEAGVKTTTILAHTGADSTITMTVTEIPTTYATVNLAVVENMLPYTYNDSTYTGAGTYTQHLTNVAGCDSVLTLVITVYENVTAVDDSTVCDDALPLVWNGVTFTQAGVQTATLLAASGADSVVVMTLTVSPTTYGTVETAIVENDLPFHLHNLTCDSAGIYTDTIVNAAGCDSVLTLTLTVWPNVTSALDSTVCEGELPITWNDSVFTEAGVKTTTILAHTGADSTITMTLTVIPTTYGTLDTAVVENVLPFHHNDSSYSEAGTYTQHLTNAAGCDSILTIHFVVYENVSVSVDSAVCEDNFPFTWNDSVFTTAGVKTTTILAHTGADSTITMTVTVSSTTYGAVDTAVVENALPFHFHNLVCDSAGVYTDTITNAAGCDSILTVSFGVFYNVTGEDDSTVCADALPFVWNGVTFAEAGTQSATLTAYTGADSVVTMTLHVNPLSYTTIETSVVQNNLPYHYVNGQIDTTFGVGTPMLSTLQFMLSNSNGCDSLVTLILTVYPNVTTSVDTTVCAANMPFTWHGHTFTVAGSHSVTLQTSHGADSTVTYTLSVDNIAATVGNVTHVTCYGTSTGAATVTVSGGQTPLTSQWTNATGSTVSTSSSISNRPAGTYTFTVTDHRGCTATATVTINTLNGELIPGTIAASQEVCDGEDIAPFTGSAASGGDNGHYQWQISTNGTGWTNAPGTSTTQGYTYPNAASNAFTLRRAWVSQSCGTVYSNEVTVSVWPNSSDTITASVCQGDVYNDNGFNVTADETAEAGVFTYEQHHATGHCDSAVILLLTVNPVTTELVEATVCEGEGYQENGFNVAPQETIGHDELTRTLNLQSGQGCDSTVTLHLSVIDTTLRLVMLTEDFCEHQEASLSVVSEMPDYVWSTGETATTIVVTSPGLYSVTASEGGCSATASIRVEACHYELVLPNAITPSRGDGLNDCFFIPESYTGDMVLFTIHIYNRWGELVFHSTDKNFRWSGEYRGQTQIQTVYNYVIEYTDSAGRPHRMVGSLTIL